MVRKEGGTDVHHSLPKVEKGTRSSEEWVKKVEPGELLCNFVFKLQSGMPKRFI